MLLAIILFVSGMLLWTFMEYTLHRSLGHLPKAKNPFSEEHMRHHYTGNYFAPAYKKALAAAVVIPLITGLMMLLVLWWQALSFAIGFTGMYLFYEWLHHHLHAAPPINGYGLLLRRHHFAHHFHNFNKNHGVTSPVWDIIFGSRLPVKDKVRVPVKLAPFWLLDEKGNPKPEYSNDFEVVMLSKG